LLRPPRADTELRLSHDRIEVLQRTRLGQLRQRPRRRERAVRAELHLCRRIDELRPGDLLPVHGAYVGPAARATRHIHAEAVHEADGKRLSLSHVALGWGEKSLSR